MSSNDPASGREETVVPVVAEELEVSKRKQPLSTVLVTKRTTEHDEAVSMPLVRERVDVKRVLVDRPVEGPQPVRREGETVILPVVEEVAVVEKRFILKEEIHVTRRSAVERHDETVTLKHEHALVERVDPDSRPLPLDADRGEPEGPRSVIDPSQPRPSVLESAGRPKPVRRNRIIKSG
jgi:uncharacterized protein (TIGR02271 family)